MAPLAPRCVVDNLSIPPRGGAGERLPVSIRTRPAPADPTSKATLHNEAIAQMAIALRLITLAFGPLHGVHDRAHSPSLGTDVRIQLSPAESPCLTQTRPLQVEN